MLNPNAPPYERSTSRLPPPPPVHPSPDPSYYFSRVCQNPPSSPSSLLYYHLPPFRHHTSPFLPTYRIHQPHSLPISSSPSFLPPPAVKCDAAPAHAQITKETSLLPVLHKSKKENTMSSPAFSDASSPAISSGTRRRRINRKRDSSSAAPATSSSSTGANALGASAASLPPLTLSVEYGSRHEDGQRTSIMIRDIPNKLSREMLIAMLDKHCAENNSEYDFIYLPIDFKNNCNLGYAFVNFTKAAAAQSFHVSLDGYEWKLFGSKKTCRIGYARIQGKKELVENFRNSSFKCISKEYLPAVLSPPRNGSTSLSAPSPIGRWIFSPS